MQFAPDPSRAHWDGAVLRHRATAQAFAEANALPAAHVLEHRARGLLVPAPA